jgi:8-oxo-dGTP diphosphatase
MYTPIVATLGYVMSPDSTAVLMIHRNTRTDDHHYGKYNGLGGKLEPYEDIVEGMQREVREEAGIEATDLTLRGTINWPGFGKQGEAWMGFIFRIDGWHGTPYTHNPEGSLEWVAVERVLDLNLWPGDRLFLPLVFGSDPRQFHGLMPYHNGQLQNWSYVLI